MTLTITLSDDEIAQVRQATNAVSDADAIAVAVREYIRICRLKELKTASGNVDFQLDWPSLGAAEVGESPQ